MGAIKDYVNQGFTVGDVTVSTFDETGARIRIKDFYDLDLVERQRIVNLAGKVDVELLNIENKIKVETDGKFTEYYKSSEVDTKFYNKTEMDSKLSNYNTKTEISNTYVPKTLTAQETMKGITNFKDIKKQVNYLSGAGYKDNNEFGSSLKSLVKGEMYYYGNIPYMAKTNATNSSGFLVPDTTNFQDIRNMTINDTLYKELLEFDKYLYSAGGSNFFKFFRYGKRATFFISYTLSGEAWSDYTKLANYTTGFKPNAEYLYSEHKIYIQTSNNTGDERLVLSGDGIVIAGIAGKQVYKVIGVIEYIAE